MPIAQDTAFYVIHVKLVGTAAANKSDADKSYYVMAFIPSYNGTITGATSLPYRELISGSLTNKLQQITWGTNPKTLPNETAQSSPFSNGLFVRYIVDGGLVHNDAATGSLIGFAQATPGNEKAVNLSVYNVKSVDQKILSLTNAFEAYVKFVCTNGNIPHA